MAKICVVGSINMDIVTYVDTFPERGETVFGEKVVESAGGKGANQSISTAKQGKEVTLIGCVGDDRHGDMLLDGLKKNKVNTDFIKQLTNTDSGKTSIIIEKSAENTIIYLEGANKALDKTYVRESIQQQTDCEVLLVQLESPYEVVLEAVKTAKEQGITVILDPAPTTYVTDELIQYADLILPNEQETEDITGIEVHDEPSARAAVAIYRKKGVHQGVLKLGSRGSYVFAEDTLTFIDGISVAAVDTVGAGDCFAGAFASAFVDKLSLVEAATYANIVAALKVTKHGAQAGMPSLEEVQAFCKERNFDCYIEK